MTDAKKEEENLAGGIRKLGELIKEIRFAMLTTVGDDGTLVSRPMATQQAEFDGNLWFFTSDDSPKAAQLLHDRHVNVAYSRSDGHCYVSVSGTASIVRERKKIEELWSPLYKAYFPKGLEDPHLVLIRVRPTTAQYWKSPSSPVVQLFGFAKAVLTGKRAGTIAENETIEFPRKAG